MQENLKRLESIRRLLPADAGCAAGNLVPLGHAPADGMLRGGLRRGALHEVFAGDESAAAAGFAAGLMGRVSAGKRVLWIRQDFAALEQGELSPLGLAELGLDPAALLLLRAANATDALRAMADGLSAPVLGAVIAEIPGNPKCLDLLASRRLVLGAERHNVTAFLLRHGATPAPSAAETRWCIRAAPSLPLDDWGAPNFDVELQRNRHGETGRWVMEWSCDDRTFREGAAHSGAVAAAAANRPAEAPAWALARTG